MKFHLRYCLPLLIAAGNFFHAHAASSDSTKRNFGINLLLSAKPFFNSLSAKDSTRNYMYSKSQFEIQFRYKRHFIGLGWNGDRKKMNNTVNNLPKNSYVNTINLSPAYGFNVYTYKRWSLFTGAGYIYNKMESGSDIISDIEIVSEFERKLETGYFGFCRFNFRLAKKFSIEFELAAYTTTEKHTLEKTFSLTPDMNVKKETEFKSQTYAFPSNISFKFSL